MWGAGRVTGSWWQDLWSAAAQTINPSPAASAAAARRPPHGRAAPVISQQPMGRGLWRAAAVLLAVLHVPPPASVAYQTGELSLAFKDSRFVKHMTDKNWQSFRAKFPQAVVYLYSEGRSNSETQKAPFADAAKAAGEGARARVLTHTPGAAARPTGTGVSQCSVARSTAQTSPGGLSTATSTTSPAVPAMSVDRTPRYVNPPTHTHPPP